MIGCVLVIRGSGRGPSTRSPSISAAASSKRTTDTRNGSTPRCFSFQSLGPIWFTVSTSWCRHFPPNFAIKIRDRWYFCFFLPATLLYFGRRFCFYRRPKMVSVFGTGTTRKPIRPAQPKRGQKKKTTKNSVTGRFSAYGYAIPGIPGRKDCGTFSIRFAGRPM